MAAASCAFAPGWRKGGIRLLIFTESITPDELRRLCGTVAVKKTAEEQTDEKAL